MFCCERVPPCLDPACPALETEAHVWTRCNQLQKVASVQWQFHNSLVFNHSAHGRIFSRQGHSGSRNFDRLRHLSNFHRDINPSHLLDLQLNICNGRQP